MPRIYQQVDWSNGGDGIVVRDTVKSIADLRGKTIVLAQNSPSHFFALNALINGGVQPSEVNFKFTQDAFQAAAAFNADKKIAGAVSWSPDIYNLAKVKGNRMLVNTTTANKLIADMWFARADFAKDNPDIIEGLVRGIFDGMESLKDQSNKAAAAKLMAAGYSIPEADALSMQGDAHSTNWAENQEFFMNQNNPTNFERTWNTAYYLYKRIGAVSDKTEFDQVMDFSVFAEAGQRSEVFEPEERVRRAVRARDGGGDSGRVRRDSHQDRGDSLLSELVGSVEEGHRRRWTGRRRKNSTIRTRRSWWRRSGKWRDSSARRAS